MAPLLELKNISMTFGAVRALKDISLHVDRGEILGLVGDNGAGKSTVLKIIGGNYQPASGELFIDGQRMSFKGPTDARKQGIELVYQDLALCNNLTAAANLFLGRELSKRAGPLQILDHEAMSRRAEELFGALNSDARADELVKTMSGGQRQAVAVARLFLAEPRIVLMDEATAAASAALTAKVLDLARDLRDRKVAVVLVSHNLPDILSVADRIAVLRASQKIAEFRSADISAEELAGLVS